MTIQPLVPQTRCSICGWGLLSFDWTLTLWGEWICGECKRWLRPILQRQIERDTRTITDRFLRSAKASRRQIEELFQEFPS